MVHGLSTEIMGRCPVGLALLRAFVALCEIHWRSFWLWRGGVFARYGRGPTPNPVEPLGSVRGADPSTRRREGNLGVAATLRHAELGSASYLLRAVGIKILKQVQDDGGVWDDGRDGGVRGDPRHPLNPKSPPARIQALRPMPATGGARCWTAIARRSR